MQEASVRGFKRVFVQLFHALIINRFVNNWQAGIARQYPFLYTYLFLDKFIITIESSHKLT
jgi:hypothetical protein